MNMTLKEIIEKCGSLGIVEVRSAGEDSYELVFFARETEQWNKLLSDILGPAIKPKGVKPTREDNNLTKDHGGIFTDQTLFKKDFDDATVLAMFWPWQDHIHTTLNLVLIKKQ